jgi:5'-nucleotidase
VFVVAPREEQSGVSHAFHYLKPLVYKEAGGYPCPAHWVDGTPADSVKFAIRHIYRHIQFDLMVSGVNSGDNAGVAAFYSGTVGAAREATLWGVRSIALSLVSQDENALNYTLAWIQKVVREKYFEGIPKHCLWNFNAPSHCEILGVKVAKMGNVMFDDSFELRPEPDNELIKKYHLVGGKLPADLHTDDWWLEEGYATLCPLQIDCTDYAELERVKEIF